jgi:hypothetical protein
MMCAVWGQLGTDGHTALENGIFKIFKLLHDQPWTDRRIKLRCFNNYMKCYILYDVLFLLRRESWIWSVYDWNM